MDTQLIVNEFRTIFQERKKAMEHQIVRGQRSGRIDPHRAGQVVHGSQQVFYQRMPVTTERSDVAGSLALICDLNDLHTWRMLGQQSKQAQAWYETMSAFYTAAKQLNLPVKLICGNGDHRGTWTRVYEFDTWEHFINQSSADARFTRQQESVQRAEAWHMEVNPRGQKLTLLVTMWPEMRTAEENVDPAKYKAFLERMAEEVPKWTRHTRFYAMGVMLQETAQNTWGEYRKFGVHNHFRACWPSAARFTVDSPDDVIGNLRSLAQRMAKLA